tara:strand:- start:267 stop:524 length:258 start_codon:yes stop_codon:yes gene_type:complete
MVPANEDQSKIKLYIPKNKNNPLIKTAPTKATQIENLKLLLRTSSLKLSFLEENFWFAIFIRKKDDAEKITTDPTRNTTSTKRIT